MNQLVPDEQLKDITELLGGATPTWMAMQGSQWRFLTCPFFEVLFEGTRGGGKTDSLLNDFHKDVGQGLGAAWRGILFRQTYPQLQDVIMKSKKLFTNCRTGGVYNESQHFWRWPGGELLMFRQFRREEDYFNYHGHEYPWIAWEELCNWPTLGGYKRMMSTCRSADKRVAAKARIRSTTNPYGPGHNVVKERFRLPGHRNVPILDAKDDDGRVEPPRMAIFSDIQENRALLEADPGYIDRLASTARNDSERKAWLNGDWDIVAGGMFDDVWNPKVHVVEPFIIPDGWRLDRSFDWGSSKPFSVGWWAESDGSDYVDAAGKWRSSVRGDLYRVREWYGWNGKRNEGLRMVASDITKGIVEREIRWGWDGRVRSGVADSSIFDTENGMCIALDMAKSVRLDNGHTHKGTQWLKADKSNRVGGWEQVRGMLKAAMPNVNKMPREKPGLFVFKTCDQFTYTFPVLPRDEKNVDDVDSDAEDHIADEVRYRVRASRGRSGRNLAPAG